MLISYSHHFLFQHIPKTAGCSIKRQLRPFKHRPDRLAVNRVLERLGVRVNLVLGPHTWKRFRTHTKMTTVRRVLPDDVFESLFKFAIVRNPWDRLVSRYHYAMQRNAHRRHRTVSRLEGFADYIQWQVDRRCGGQAAMLFDNAPGGAGRLLVDYVGRFETLADDYAAITQRIGIVTPPLERRNTSRRGDYRSYYNDATRELVAQHWRRDIKAFGYEFDGIAAPIERVA